MPMLDVLFEDMQMKLIKKVLRLASLFPLLGWSAKSTGLSI
jgi:hypothetical protein